MQTSPQPRQTVQNPAGANETAPAAEPMAAEDALSGIARGSPARALQGRLMREITLPNHPWRWHSCGLVIIVVLSLWIAGLLLTARV